MGQPSPANVDSYEVGALIRLSATFVSTDLVTPADPSTVLVEVVNAWGSIACYAFGAGGASIARAGVGAYYKDITNDTPGGVVAYRWLGTAGVQAARSWEFVSPPSKFVF